MALLFGIAGLILTGIVLVNADTIVCAISASSGDCAPMAPALSD